MPHQTLIEKYAKLAVEIGANVQKDQMVVIRSSTETTLLARALTEAAYKAGAKRVHVNWSDDYVSRQGLEHMSLETLQTIPDWVVEQSKYAIEEGACFISITSPIPGLNAGIDPVKMQQSGLAAMKKLGFFQAHMMANRAQWTVIAAPNPVWAKKVFPDKREDDAVEALWEAILKACHVTEDNDPVAAWDAHNKTLAAHNAKLNDYQFDALHFTNSLGTDFTLRLVDNHIWAGGSETTSSGIVFNPNIPTEESFTMPHKHGTNGRVYATKPLNYQGNLIEDFWIEFKDGEAIDFGAEKAEESLRSLLEFDEGSRFLGEIALVSHYSPISQSEILFLNTLFDENASCHMALGRAYPMNLKEGVTMDEKGLEAAGANLSKTHVDFMFGSADMKIVGIHKDGSKRVIFEHGDFVL